MSVATGSPELDDVLETLHYRLVVSQPPDAAMKAIAHLLCEVPAWLDELVADQPDLKWGRKRIIEEKWKEAAGTLETAGERLFRQLEMFG